ncbi:Hypothetical protein NTJ_08059 [Nesidiocoris tenuis]|uniref:Uncharacterized protein n=1 Tax=Nesidiocoris tenuis TaxID=355587 RepID=A0ABN7AWC3_9HEMI|nr:Hypothetical protein NTJ_08059 [Nesidiocoris tenuis]
MTLPVSSYEELLSRVRSLTNETRQLQRQIDAPLLDHNENERLMNSSFAAEWAFKPRADGFTLETPITASTPQANKVS